MGAESDCGEQPERLERIGRVLSRPRFEPMAGVCVPGMQPAHTC